MDEGVTVILIVDDEPIDRQGMKKALEGDGYLLLEAVDPAQAIRIAAERHWNIDLLLTDISLPGSNGCELAKRLLRQRSDLKVLFVSGYVGAEVCRYYGIPIADLFFLRKPFEGAELVARVRKVLESPDRAPLSPDAEDANADRRRDHA